jgi:transposase
MVTMSQKKFQRVKVIENAAGGRLSVREASRLLQLSERQVQRLKRRYRPDSVGGVQHGNRGRSMPWAVTVPQKQLILTLARGKYRAGRGPRDDQYGSAQGGGKPAPRKSHKTDFPSELGNPAKYAGIPTFPPPRLRLLF